MSTDNVTEWQTNSTVSYTAPTLASLLYRAFDMCADHPYCKSLHGYASKLQAFSARFQSVQALAACSGIVIVIACACSLALHRIRRENRHRERELAKRINNFTPCALENEIQVEGARETIYATSPRIVSGRVGKTVTIVGEGTHLNLATHNYLGLADLPRSQERALAALKTYGLGACGPRKYFGTLDSHLKLESDIAQFMGVESACLYMMNFAVMCSSIPAHVKPEDVIFADEAVNFAISLGIKSARCEYHYFKHNDYADLERLLHQNERRGPSRRRKGGRRSAEAGRFIILEGIYMNSGTLVNLPEIVALRARYRCRLLVDESVSFGVLGKHGGGVFEHFSIDRSEVDLIAGSFEHSLGTFGGFACGTHYVIEHNRLHSKWYTSSTPLPAFQTEAVIANLQYLANEPERCAKLRDVCMKVHDVLQDIRGLYTGSDPLSPVKYLVFHTVVDGTVLTPDTRIPAQQRVDHIVAFAARNNVALTPARYINEREENMRYDPAVKLLLNCDLNADDVNKLGKTLRDACDQSAP